MAIKTKHTFPNAVGTNGQSATVFAGHGIELNNLNDLDVYVTLSGGTRVLQLHQSTGSTAIGSGSGKHPQVNNTDGLYFPAVSAGTTLYNYQLTNANDTITFNSALPTGAVVTVERRTRDAAAAYTTFAGGSTIRHTDLNRSATESNYTAQEGRNKAFELEGKIFGDAAKDSSFITSADIVDGTIVAADLATDSVTTVKIQDNAVTADKLAHTSVSAGSYTAADITVDAQGRLTSASSGTISASEIAGDAINGDKIADNSINSEHYVDGSIDAVHLATDSVTAAKIEANAVGTSELATNAVTTLKVAADAINGDKIADNSINSEHYVDGSIDTIHIGDNQINTAKLADNAVETANILDNNVTMAKLGSGALPTDITVNADNLVGSSVGTSEIATDAVNGSKIADNAIDSEHYTDGSIDTAHIGNLQVTRGKIAADAIDGTKLADNAVDTEHIAANAVTTSEIADAELKTLAGMQSGTASILAGSTALAATTGEINTICDGKSVETTISDTDAAYPTSGAVVDYVAAQIAPLGGLEVIATDAAFPNTQPAAGVVISIADAGGLVVNGSGTSTTGRTVGGSTVTINNINSQFNSTTVDNGVAMMVSSTGSGQIYNYHKATLKEADLLSLSGDINDFAERYRVAGSAPSSSLDEGDLWWDTATDKLKVYDGSSWDEVASSGDFYINTISSYSGTGGNSATFNGSAYRFVLSNPGSTAQQHIVSINGVIQKPNSGTSQPSEGFAIDGSSIIFSNAPASGSDYFILTIGTAVSIGTPSDNTVSTAKLQNLAVTGDKIATNLDLADNKKIRFGTGNDLEIYHSGDHSIIREAGTGNLAIQSTGGEIQLSKQTSFEHMLRAVTDGAVHLYYDNSLKFETISSGAYVYGNLYANDSDQHRFGNDGDLQIYHDTQNWIKSGVDGTTLHIDHDLTQIRNHGGTEVMAKFIENGAVELYYDNSKKMDTLTDGIGVLGVVYSQGLDVDDNHIIKVGDGDDLQIYHDGSNSYITNTGGNLNIKADDLQVRGTNDELIATFNENSDCQLYHNGSLQLQTTSTGININNGGIRLGGNNAANELDDYEEGTYTPTLTYLTSDDGNKSYNVQHGVYTKIGRSVTVHFHLEFSNKGTGSGAIGISLPFAVPNLLTSTSLEAGGVISYFSGLSTSWSDMKPIAIDGQSRVEIYGVANTHSSGVSLFGYSHIGNAWSLRGTITYFT